MGRHESTNERKMGELQQGSEGGDGEELRWKGIKCLSLARIEVDNLRCLVLGIRLTIGSLNLWS